jgi:hypothetical protein
MLSPPPHMLVVLQTLNGPADTGANVSRHKPDRVWTAVISVEGYTSMPATWSEKDAHDDQIMQAAHDALRLMRTNGEQVGFIDLFRDSPETGNQHVEQRRVTVDERGIVVSENLTPW